MMIVRQVAEALQFAHTEGVVHRDVKPSNIIIDTRGRPIVTDFGIAKVMSAKSVTVTGSMLGTPTYMSPEQCRGLPATVASDQYSLGVMAYEMLSGKVPFAGTIYELIHAHCVEPPPPFTVPELDKGIEETVLRMLAKSPPERWESLSEVAKRLAGTMPANSKSEEMQAVVAGYVRGEPKRQIGRSSAATLDLADQATQLATTPAKSTPAPGLVVTPDQPSIEVGQTLQLRVSQSSGASLAGVNTRWKSEDPTIATVDDSGLVTGRSVGLAKITVTGGAAIGRVAVSVRAQSVETLVITPQNPEIVTDAEIQFVATVLDARGSTLAGQVIHWQSSDVSVCAISGQGRAIGISPGKVTITATCGDIQVTAHARVRLPAVERVTVDPGEVSIEAEDTKRLTATVYAAMDRKITGRPITWKSTVPAVVSVDVQGTIKGVSPGTGAVIATCDGKDGIASISVRSQPVVVVRIQPEQLQLEVGRSLQLKGVGEDRRGRSVTEKNIEWQSDNDNIAIVDASGKVHAVHEGRTVVRATAGDVTSTLAVTIIPRVAATIRIDAHKPTLEAGEFLSLDATVLDADGGSLEGREIIWTSTDPAIVSIDRNGTCEGKKPGAARITAASDRARASTKLSVSAVRPVAAPVAGPGVSPPRDTSRDAETQKLERVVLPLPKVEAKAQPKADREAAPRTEPKPPPSAVQTERKKGRGVPIGIAVVVVAAIGIWAATKGGGTPAVVTPPPQTQTKVATVPPVDTQVAVIPPPVTTPPETTVVAPPPSRGTPPVTPPAGRAGTSTASTPPNTSRGNTPPNTARGNTPPPATNTARGTTPPPRTDTATNARGTTNPPVTPPPTTTTNPPPVTTNPPPVTNPPVTTNPPVANPPESPSALCSNPSTPSAALTAALSGNLVNAVTQLYQPANANDGKQKEEIIKQIKAMNQAKASVRAVRAETAGSGCDWVMVVDFTGVSFVGAQRRSTWQMKMQLDGTASSARVKNLFGATRQ
jgi:serine/threonine-protein kinase